MHSYIACTMIYPFIFGLFKISCYLSLAYIIKPFDISIESLLLSLIIGAMGLLSLVGFSFISCAFVLVFKQGDPVNYILTISITLLAGVLFPVSALPSFMQNLSNMLPISHSLEIMRKVIIFNSPEYFLPEVFGFLLIFMFTTTIFGVIILEFAIKQIKMRGTSGDY